MVTLYMPRLCCHASRNKVERPRATRAKRDIHLLECDIYAKFRHAREYWSCSITVSTKVSDSMWIGHSLSRGSTPRRTFFRLAFFYFAQFPLP